MNTIELLAPAKDFEAAQAAIACGADAIYIGAPQFSARQAAGNSLDDIRRVVELAHVYYVRVYVALNTILRDEELPAARALIEQLHAIGIDGLIIQDMGLLEMELPAVPIIASTQSHNASLEKVRFLEAAGFSRAILARELTVEQIAAISAGTSIELECFVHGALCVGTSGRCAMSYAIGGRSGNRGVCAQPCRRRYTLKNSAGEVIARDQFLLSLKDLNLSDDLAALLDAGVTSFKIEGRLKEAPYVANIVGYYRRKLDAILQQRGLKKSSSGQVTLNFEPDPAKTFNRGFTDYGLHGRGAAMGSIDTPKSRGEAIGTIAEIGKDWFTLSGDIELHNGDGICFFDAGRRLCGTVINRVAGGRIYPQKMDGLRVELAVYRNHDHAFLKQLQSPAQPRTIDVTMTLTDTDDGVAVRAVDEDGHEAVFELAVEKQPADKAEQAIATAQKQLSRLGNTSFACSDVRVETRQVYFFPVSVLNTLKRGVVEKLLRVRQANRPRLKANVMKPAAYPAKELTFAGNVLNEKARRFYHQCGVETIAPAAESGMDLHSKTVMTTKYCLRRQLGLCRGYHEQNIAEPLILIDEDDRQFEAVFRCGDCGMIIKLEN